MHRNNIQDTRDKIPTLFLVTGGMIALLFFAVYASHRYDLNSIRNRTVGHGQHGTTRWATVQEVKRTFHHVPFTPNLWRKSASSGKQPTSSGKPLPQGIVLGCKGGKHTTALVDADDVHVLMIGASGVGKKTVLCRQRTRWKAPKPGGVLL